MPKMYVAVVSNTFERKPKELQIDSGGEFFSHHTQAFLGEHGILYTPEQNGITERWLRSFMEIAACMLVDEICPKAFGVIQS